MNPYELTLNDDFRPVVGLTITRVDSWKDEKGYIHTLDFHFGANLMMRMDMMKKPKGKALFAMLHELEGASSATVPRSLLEG